MFLHIVYVMQPKIRDKFDLALKIARLSGPGIQDFKSGECTARCPCSDAFTVEHGLLGRQGGGDDIVYKAQCVGAVARAHQLFGAAGDLRVSVQGLTAVGIGSIAAAGAEGGGHRSALMAVCEWRRAVYHSAPDPLFEYGAMNVAQYVGRMLALGFWLAVAVAALGLLPATAARLLLLGGGVLFLLHGAQLLIWRRALACYSRNKLRDALGVLLFGIFHLATLMPRAEAPQDAADAQ